MKTQCCYTCKQDLPYENFHKAKKTKAGISGQCKSCYSEYYKEYRKRNAEAIKERTKERREKDPEKHRARNRQWYRDNKEHCAAKAKEYRKATKQHCIYQILMPLENKVYIGETTNYSQRKRGHKSDCKNSKHCNTTVQAYYDKHGWESMEMTILEEFSKNKTSKLDRLKAEIRWIETLLTDENLEVVNLYD